MMKYYVTETELFTFAGFGAVFYFLYSYNLFPFIIGIFVGGILTILYMANFAVVKILPLIRNTLNKMTMKPEPLFDIFEKIKKESNDVGCKKEDSSSKDENKQRFRHRGPFYC